MAKKHKTMMEEIHEVLQRWGWESKPAKKRKSSVKKRKASPKKRKKAKRK